MTEALREVRGHARGGHAVLQIGKFGDGTRLVTLVVAHDDPCAIGLLEYGQSFDAAQSRGGGVHRHCVSGDAGRAVGVHVGVALDDAGPFAVQGLGGVDHRAPIGSGETVVVAVIAFDDGGIDDVFLGVRAIGGGALVHPRLGVAVRSLRLGERLEILGMHPVHAKQLIAVLRLGGIVDQVILGLGIVDGFRRPHAVGVVPTALDRLGVRPVHQILGARDDEVLALLAPAFSAGGAFRVQIGAYHHVFVAVRVRLLQLDQVWVANALVGRVR